MRTTLLCLAALGLVAPSLHADVTPAALFTDNAVLQRDKPVPVWGAAAAGEHVSVTFHGHAVSTVADASGRWRVELPAGPADAKPADLVIKGHNTVTLANVVVGDVWLASGQSNMEFTVKRSYDAAIDIPASAGFPQIREITIGRKIAAEQPADTTSGLWKVAGPDTTGSFTAVGYFFALNLHSVLHIPIGIINSTWGGTNIESWVDPDSLKTPGLAFVGQNWTKSLADYPAREARYRKELDAWKKAKAAAAAAKQPFDKRAPWDVTRSGPGGLNTPACLYNGMIHPLIPFALRGFIWYQGENNVGSNATLHDYHPLFAALITGWRKQFGQGDLPFYWVQLPNYSYGHVDGTQAASLREAQAQTLSLPATGQAVTIDLGNASNIHPCDKRDVGRRLARVALVRDYGWKIADSGPVVDKAARDGAGYRLTFVKGTADGLMTPLNTLSGFELAGADKVFHPADAKIENGAVLVTSAAVPAPVAVRYAWRNAPVAGLYNGEGLPAAPFRSDDW